MVFIRAWALRRQGRFAEALPLIEAVPASIDPMRRAQLLGEIADRLGETQRAFAAFTAMNRAAEPAARPLTWSGSQRGRAAPRRPRGIARAGGGRRGAASAARFISAKAAKARVGSPSRS